MPKRLWLTGIRASAGTDSILHLSFPKDVLEYEYVATSHELSHGYPVHTKKPELPSDLRMQNALHEAVVFKKESCRVAEMSCSSFAWKDRYARQGLPAPGNGPYSGKEEIDLLLRGIEGKTCPDRTIRETE